MRSIATDAPDLVLLDVVMPGMTGYDVCRQIRANDSTKFVPIVMMTASPDQDKVAAIESGADDFAFKPFDKQELLARLGGTALFRREGEFWTAALEGAAFRLRDSKGLHCIAALLREPGRERHALDLVGSQAPAERSAMRTSTE